MHPQTRPQKFDFQLSTTKPNNSSHPTIETGQNLPLVWFFEGGFVLKRNKKNSN